MAAGPPLARMAWRNLWRHRRRTILTLLSIAFGVFLAILFTALQDRSFADMIDTAARMGGGHVSVQHPDYLDTPKLSLTLEHTADLEAAALADPQVERVVSRIMGEAMVSTTQDSFGAAFIGYDPTREDEVTFEFTDGIIAGEPLTSPTGRGIIVGQTLARNLGVEVGDRIVIRMMGKDGEVTGTRARIQGLLATGSPSADAALCLLPIDRLRAILGYGPDEATLLAVYLNDPRSCDAAATRLGATLGSGVVALTWDAVRPGLSGFIAMKVGGARFMELVILLLVAAGIFNTLFVSVMERTREFGVMLAIGYAPGQVFALVMFESVWLAITGLVAGAAVTIYPYWTLARNGIDMSAMMGDVTTEVAGIGFDPILRVGIFADHVVIIGVAVAVATLLAGIYPAWRAARVPPVEAIRLV